MIVDFSRVDVNEPPMLILQNLDDTPVGVLKFAFNVEAEFCYNEISTLTFDLPAYVDGVKTPFYDKVAGMRLINLKDYGRFVLINPKVEDDGIAEIKKCTAHSLEYELSFKKLSLTAGTYNLWNPVAPSGTIMGMILEKMPSWSLGEVDASLIDRYRTFDNSGVQNIYHENTDKSSSDDVDVTIHNTFQMTGMTNQEMKKAAEYYADYTIGKMNSAVKRKGIKNSVGSHMLR